MSVSHLSGFENRRRTHAQAGTEICWSPTKSLSKAGSPSSRSMAMTSWRFACSSSRLSPWLWAPGKPGTGRSPPANLSQGSAQSPLKVCAWAPAPPYSVVAQQWLEEGFHSRQPSEGQLPQQRQIHRPRGQGSLRLQQFLNSPAPRGAVRNAISSNH